MPYLKLQLLTSGTTLDVRDAVATLGRDPAATVTFSGDEARVVSTRHAELRHQDGGWVLVDLESRNGSYVNGRRVQGQSPVAAGDEIRLGETGPRLIVVATNEVVGATLAEHPAYLLKESAAAPAAPSSPRPPEARPYGITLIATATGKRFEAKGTRIRLGRGKECEVRPVEGGEGVVSRVHAELTVGPSGGLSLRDVGSKNGTFLNGDRIGEPMPVRLGDRITLGPGGPVLVVEGIGTGPMKAAQRPASAASPAAAPEVMGQKTVMGLINSALEQAREERRRGGRGSTAFLKAVAAEVGKDSRRKFRWITASIVILVLVLGAGVFGVYQLLSQQVAQTEVARRSSEDSSRAEAERLRQALDSARAQAAPAATVDSLRVQLESAQARTTELSEALSRAQSALGQQLSAGETQRQASERELQRLRDQLTEAQKSAPSSSQIDSLRRQVTAAEAQTASLDARMRAVRGTDFATIAQQNQGAVGLITVDFGKNYYNGTGFVISPDGYMLTNWHVVTDSGYPKPDTIWVTMADQSASRFADVVVTSQDRDIALIKIRMYQGPSLTAIDWGGTKSRQGEPAALIGYPAGAGFARYRSSVVRTSMTAGIISRVTDDVIQFDGMTVGGSSGSPVFNANGEVISIHRAGLPQAPGFALSVPIRHAVPLFPPELKQRLGIQ